jgi:hypothetical protein
MRAAAAQRVTGRQPAVGTPATGRPRRADRRPLCPKSGMSGSGKPTLDDGVARGLHPGRRIRQRTPAPARESSPLSGLCLILEDLGPPAGRNPPRSVHRHACRHFGTGANTMLTGISTVHYGRPSDGSCPDTGAGLHSANVEGGAYRRPLPGQLVVAGFADKTDGRRTADGRRAAHRQRAHSLRAAARHPLRHGQQRRPDAGQREQVSTDTATDLLDKRTTATYAPPSGTARKLRDHAARPRMPRGRHPLPRRALPGRSGRPAHRPRSTGQFRRVVAAARSTLRTVRNALFPAAEPFLVHGPMCGGYRFQRSPDMPVASSVGWCLGSVQPGSLPFLPVQHCADRAKR